MIRTIPSLDARAMTMTTWTNNEVITQRRLRVRKEARSALTIKGTMNSKVFACIRDTTFLNPIENTKMPVRRGGIPWFAGRHPRHVLQCRQARTRRRRRRHRRRSWTRKNCLITLKKQNDLVITHVVKSDQLTTFAIFLVFCFVGRTKQRLVPRCDDVACCHDLDNVCTGWCIKSLSGHLQQPHTHTHTHTHTHRR